MEIKGVDISYCQKGIDYKKMIADGVKFAIIRTGFSETEDNLLSSHVSGCQAVGIDIGYYWYSYAKTVEEARKEAAACLKVIKKYPAPKYPVFFDAEEDKIAKANGREVTTDLALAFCEEIEKGGYPSGIYANPNWLENHYDKSRIAGKVDIWLAHWTESPSSKSRYDYGQKVWQWGLSQIGNMDVDGDLCFVDYPAQTEEWYKKHSATPAPPSPTTPEKSVEQLAQEVIDGKWGNGADRKNRLTSAGYDYQAVQDKVNEILYSSYNSQKSVDEIAREVIAGLWGNGTDRKAKLTAEGYDYAAVQKRVNEMLKK